MRQDGQDIWDAFHGISAFTNWRHKVRLKQEQINSASSNRCGNCSHWMATTCYPEKQLKQFKSCESFGCSAFDRTQSSIRSMAEYAADMEQIMKEKP